VIDPQARPEVVIHTRPVWWDLPIPIAIIIGLVHFFRGAIADGVVFVSIGLALAVAGIRDRRKPAPPATLAPRRPPGLRWLALGAVGCLGYGVLVGQWAPGSVPAMLAVIVPGVLILPLAWRVGPVSGAPRPGAGRWAWGVVVVLACLWELNSFLRQPDPRTASYDHPTLSAILTPVFESPAVRSVLLAVWLAIGLWLARQLSTAPDEDRR
jgi:hypothetical protein